MKHPFVMRLFLVFLAFLILGTGPLNALAAEVAVIPPEDMVQGFNPDAILSDHDIFRVEMSYEDLKLFLASHGALGHILMKDIDGFMKSPADIIWRIANSYQINPKYLLALLQKEQSLVDDPNPSQRQLDWATGFAVCDSCSKDDPRIQAYKGFSNQLEYAAKQHRERYLQQILVGGTTISGYAPGILKTIDGIPVTPQNNATAMLYTYTPHIHGNLNLWHIWQRWFSVDLPEGSVVRGKTSKDIYLIRFGTKRRFHSIAVVASIMDPDKIFDVEDSQLGSYTTGKQIAFPNYSLIKTPDGAIYLITSDKKRHISSMAVFRALGFLEDDVIDVSYDDVTQYDDGADITSTTQFPTGILAQDPKGTIWYLEDGFKQRIPNQAVLSLYFKGWTPKKLPQAQFDEFSDKGVYTLRDGELIRATTAPDVYVVEQGTLRPILSGEVFEAMGWKWRNVITLADDFVDGYPKGLPINLTQAPVATPQTTLATQSDL